MSPLAMGLVLLAALSAEEFCATDAAGRRLLCVEQAASGDATRVEFHAVNRYDFPVTVTFRPTFVNMGADATFPLVKVVAPGARVRAYAATRTDSKRPNSWNNDWTMRLGPDGPAHDDSVCYRLPLPKRFPLMQGPGGETHHGEFHHSVDWDTPVGTPILAARSGKVIHAVDRFSGRSLDPSYKERTNTLVLLHADGTQAEYSHLDTGTLKVKLGQQVKAGEVLALTGDVGYSGAPHLHFRVFRLVHGIATESLAVRFCDAQGRPLDVLGTSPGAAPGRR